MYNQARIRTFNTFALFNEKVNKSTTRLCDSFIWFHLFCLILILFPLPPLALAARSFLNHWLCAFFPFTLFSPYLALSIRGLCLLYRALGIKSDSLRDWMCVAMARCIWEAIHSAGTLWFNLKRDWCWQTSHPLSSKCFLRCPTSIADGQRAHFVMVISRPSSKNNTIKTDLNREATTESFVHYFATGSSAQFLLYRPPIFKLKIKLSTKWPFWNRFMNVGIPEQPVILVLLLKIIIKHECTQFGKTPSHK